MSRASAAEPTLSSHPLPPIPRDVGAWSGFVAACSLGLILGGSGSPVAAAAAGAAACFFLALGAAEAFAVGFQQDRAAFWLTALVAAGGLLLALVGDGLPAGVAPAALACAMVTLLAHGASRAAHGTRRQLWSMLAALGTAGAAALVAVAGGAGGTAAAALWLLAGAHLVATLPAGTGQGRVARAARGAIAALAAAGAAALASPVVLVALLPALAALVLRRPLCGRFEPLASAGLFLVLLVLVFGKGF